MEQSNQMGNRMTIPAPKSIAMAYVPYQRLNSLYEPEQALRCGSLFPELVRPFLGRKGCVKR